MFGFLNIYKPEGITSFDVIAKLRKVLHIKQIGHTGTLDPFAVGVLPVCIGKSTRLIEYLDDDKEYLATVQFGAQTDTCDKDGQVIKTYEKKITKEELSSVLKDFSGEIEQVPPIYSAIKVNGKKLYEYARNGENVDIKSRKVIIYNSDLISFDEHSQSAKIVIGCSKGTYIRSIARDIGQKLNCGGYLIALERTKAGMFRIENSVKLEDIKSVEDASKILIEPVEVISGNFYYMNELEKKSVSCGMQINIRHDALKSKFAKSLSQEDYSPVVFFIYGDKMYGVGIIQNDIIKVKKVFEVL